MQKKPQKSAFLATFLFTSPPLIPYDEYAPRAGNALAHGSELRRRAWEDPRIKIWPIE
jgi:hypothetical protein